MCSRVLSALLVVWFHIPLVFSSDTRINYDFTSDSGDADLKKLFAGFTPVKDAWIDELFDSGQTQGPLNWNYHRVDILLDASEKGWTLEKTNNLFIDHGSQEKLVKTLTQSGHELLVTCALHSKLRHALDNDRTRKKALGHVSILYEELADRLLEWAPKSNIYLEIFNEPELFKQGTWGPGYANYNDFWEEFYAAYIGVNKARKHSAHLKLGGPGFAFSGMKIGARSDIFENFLTSAQKSGVKLDFTAFHHYEGWKDHDVWPTSSNSKSVNSLENRAREVRRLTDSYAKAIGQPVQVFITELNWVDGNWNVGPKQCKKYDSYQGAARTLETLSMALEAGKRYGIDRVFWAQSNGQVVPAWKIDDFYTLMNYIPGEHKYEYRSSYYAFWFYGRMPEQRRKSLVSGNSDIQTIATTDGKSKHGILIWNRSLSSPHTMDLNLAGLSESWKTYKCSIFTLGSQSNHDSSKQFPIADKRWTTLGDLAKSNLELDPEGSAYIEFTGALESPHIPLPKPDHHALPDGWKHCDIGNVAVRGDAQYENGIFTVKGSGRDIWNHEDEFHFVYRPLKGDGEIVAQVLSITKTDRWAKAGVMIRNSLDPASASVMAEVTPQGTNCQRRNARGEYPSYTFQDGKGKAPYWIRVRRSGKQFSMYRSIDGKTWHQIQSVNLSFNTTVWIGLAVTSHHDGEVNTAQFAHVTLKD